MGLFDHKQTNHYEAQPLYTLGNSQNLLIVGLGNIGATYTDTRHNIGFKAVDMYHESRDFSDWIEKRDLQCFLATGIVGSTRVIIIKPTTMMNLSGEAVQRVMQFYKITEPETLVIHDELDLSFGTVKTKTGGGSAGHNGIKSILQHVAGDFGRIRIGIGPKTPEQIDTADFVLQKFTDEHLESSRKILKEVSALIDERTVETLNERTIRVL